MDREKEKQLVEASRKNPEAFGALFDEYYPKILRYAIYRSGNAEAARDIASETFFKALKNLWQFKWMSFPFSSWLYRIASNEVNMYFRKLKYEPISLEAAIEENNMPELASQKGLEEELVEAQALIDSDRNFTAIKKALYKLPKIYQEALVLRFFEGRMISEICEILGKKDGTVKSLISRGLKLLRETVQPNEGPGITYNERFVKKEAE